MAYISPRHSDDSRAERRVLGKSLRKRVPRTSHADWEPAADRPDPVALLKAQDEGRLKNLLPIKYGRMLASPFAFFRGTAVLMAADLANTPTTSLDVLLCGDAHISNFGFFASPERNLVFDLNDFDETFPGPWEWDLKRLATSAAIAGRDNGFSEKVNRDLAQEAARVYRLAMRHFSKMQTLDVWYYHTDSESIMDIFEDSASKKAHKAVEKVIAKATSKTQEQTLEKLTIIGEDGHRKIKEEPPLLVPIRLREEHHLFNEENTHLMLNYVIDNAWEQYLDSLDLEKRFLLSHYQIQDVALRVGGVGSVGTRCMIALLHGGADDDGLLLQIKEAGPSVLADYLPKRDKGSEAQRVVLGQQLMQTTNDIFLGWHHSEITDTEFYWRQLKDMKGSIDAADLDEEGLNTYIEVCALCLARAHARTGDPATLTGYLGKSKRF